jgi:hypothetical protein
MASYPLHSRHLVQVLAGNIYHHKVVNNSSYNLGLIMPSSLITMGSNKYSWSHVDLRTDPHTFSDVTFFQRGLNP